MFVSSQASGLSCFQRNNKRTVPGCKSGGSGDVSAYDYCTSGASGTPARTAGGRHTHTHTRKAAGL